MHAGFILIRLSISFDTICKTCEAIKSYQLPQILEFQYTLVVLIS